MSAVTQILCPRCRRENLRRARFCQHCGSDVVLNDGGSQHFFITRVIKEGGQGAVFAAIDAEETCSVRTAGDLQTGHAIMIFALCGLVSNKEDTSSA
jgi:hypothetical protein